ncbi:Ger(x)C family spore germination C-terminal domain-containing protein [Paenibacillus humicola]|uniref:Ger(x)C family spore germination protein n=1 Tax=Paenibacillus humicola TaxID=3110540 RepID=UPI00237A8CAD|nr:Ger(x)C family spore germination C-terminal domain-containing protein [Paenibacillus humicola]
MRFIKSAISITLVGSVVLSSTGCSPLPEKNIIEELAPVVFWSIDKGNEGKIKITTLVPPLTSENKQMLSLQVRLLKQEREKFNFNYYRELKLGQMRILFINKEIAKRGIDWLLNSILLSPDISQRLFLVIIDGDLTAYITNHLKQQNNLDYYFYRMLKHYKEQDKGEIAVMNLHQFMKRLYSTYSYPVLPVFRANKTNLVYEGTALFKGDKLIAVINQIDNHILQLMHKKHNLITLAIPGLSVSLGNIHANVRKKMNADHTSLSINVDLSSRIEEYHGEYNLFDAERMEDLSTKIEVYLQKQTTELFKQMQKWKVDPLQIGLLTQSPFSRPISSDDWDRQWEQMHVHVEYHLHIQPLTDIYSNHG